MNMQALVHKYMQLNTQQKRVVLFITITISLSLVILGCQTLAHKKVIPAPLMIRHGKEIVIPATSPLRDHLVIKSVYASCRPHKMTFPGIIEADPLRTVQVLPPLTGRIIQLNVQWGDMVKKGQTLVVISSPDLAQASADKEKAHSVLAMAKKAFDRAVKDYKIGGTSLQNLQATQNDFEQATAELARASERLNTLGKYQSSQLSVNAPISGQISNIYYGIGSYINDSTAPLFTINNIESLYVAGFIPENYIRHIKRSGFKQ